MSSPFLPGADQETFSPAPLFTSARALGSQTGCSRRSQSIIFSRTWQRRSQAAPEFAALMRARTSMDRDVQSVTCRAFALPSHRGVVPSTVLKNARISSMSAEKSTWKKAVPIMSAETRVQFWKGFSRK